ncbi:LysR family transcriptional regulator [Bradyrhizobium sp. AZCC 2289]|uniref:LysR family transcriptional regulator n=1 Tax=Bradyrhizobium sp. AZCC 2289 TaxID=3117026 RepID=UPI002FF066C3
MKQQPSLSKLSAFITIVKHSSFRAAADELCMSPSALSHMMRGLEERLGLRLFNRTTRSVAPTDAGDRLFRNLAPLLHDLDRALTDVGELRDRPTGRLRINASEEVGYLLMGKIVPVFLERYPEMHLELVTGSALIDIVAEGFDAGVRPGDAVPQDMVAVPFAGKGRFLAVASPAYLERNGAPRRPEDLAFHRCIRFRLPNGKMCRWEFARPTEEFKLHVEGAVTLDHMGLMVDAAIRGLGIAYVSAETAKPAVAAGELVGVLEDWMPTFAGHHLYYPSHRLVPAGLRAFIDVLREIDREDDSINQHAGRFHYGGRIERASDSEHLPLVFEEQS